MQDSRYAGSWAATGAQQRGLGMYGMGYGNSYACQYAYGSPAYWMANYATAGSSAYAAYGAAYAAQSAMLEGRVPSTSSAGGKVGDYKNLLEEMKAKQAVRDKHKRLSEQMAKCDKGDTQSRGELQKKLNGLEHELWVMGDNTPTHGGRSSTSSGNNSLESLKPPDDGRADQFSRVCHALVELLRTYTGHVCPLSAVEADRKVQREWNDLVRSRVIPPSTRLKQLFRARPALFQLQEDDSGGFQVLLVGELDGKETAAGASGKSANAPAVASEELQSLERLLQGLTTERQVIGEAMAFCIDNGTRHSALLAKSLTKSLQEPGLSSDKILSRLFLISDVLYNSNAGVKGAARYHTVLQDLLPDAFELVGREWFQSMERGHLEQLRAESAVRRMLGAWHDWAVFPPLFCRGLESLLFAPVVAISSPDGLEGSEAFHQRLVKWFSPAENSRLLYAARLRGLSGPSLPVVECRARLCHFEWYWRDAFEEAGSPKLQPTLDPSCHPLEGSIDGDSLSEGDADVGSDDEDAWGDEPCHCQLGTMLQQPEGGGEPPCKRQRVHQAAGL